MGVQNPRARRPMIDLALTPFTYGYMETAIWVSALVGAVCAFLSA